ncbi:MAG: NAD(P)H-hydrate dehydratase [Variovorax sp.]
MWFDDLGIDARPQQPAARLAGVPQVLPRRHASHKGSYGDVAVIGGAPGMVGAALLAAQAALYAGAGRVFVAPLDAGVPMFDLERPELMFRLPQTLDVQAMTVVCGCGGGAVVSEVLPRVLRMARSLVLDADALNAVATDLALQRLLCERTAADRATVLTPHPLEAARLLGISTADVQADRLRAARLLVERFGAAVVLKGSGSVIAAKGETPVINMTGNARLATAGTGDVLAGMIGAALAAGEAQMTAACAAVWRHGELADRWPSDRPLTASALARG